MLPEVIETKRDDGRLPLVPKRLAGIPLRGDAGAHDPPKCVRFGDKIHAHLKFGARPDAKPASTFAGRAPLLLKPAKTAFRLRRRHRSRKAPRRAGHARSTGLAHAG